MSRFSPTVRAATWALMSPIRSSGTRMLARMTESRSSSITPSRKSFTGGSRSPSCWTSVARDENPPGTEPPVSGQWPVFDR